MYKKISSKYMRDTHHLRKAGKTSLCSSCLNGNSNPYTAGFHSTTLGIQQITNNLLYQ